MSNQSPYEQLGVSEGSSFEEIQAARDRLVAQYEGDRKQQEAVEAAYDAVLMDRLRLRQEGKIKVPDRIRFPERLVQPLPKPAATSEDKAPGWLKNWLDTPAPADIWLPAGILAALSTVVIFVPSFNVVQGVLLVAVGASFYFLYRKERKLGRSVLLTMLGLFLGFLLGGVLGSLLQAPLANLNLVPQEFAVLFTFFVFWVISSFLK
jgi:hypothetical protein